MTKVIVRLSPEGVGRPWDRCWTKGRVGNRAHTHAAADLLQLPVHFSKCISQNVFVKMYFLMSLNLSDQMSQRSELSRIAL